MEDGHLPVLVDEVMTMLAPAPGSLQVDATLGGGDPGYTPTLVPSDVPSAM